METLAKQLRLRDPAAFQKLETLNGEEVLELAKQLIHSADGLEDVSLSFLVVGKAAARGVRSQLENWLSDTWDLLPKYGRAFYLYSALDRTPLIATGFLVDLFNREATSNFEKLRIAAGIFRSLECRGAAEELRRMFSVLCDSAEDDIRERSQDMSLRFEDGFMK